MCKSTVIVCYNGLVDGYGKGGQMEHIKVSVSPVIRQDGRQKIFISFIDEEDEREAEAIIPGLVFIKKNFLQMNRAIYWKPQGLSIHLQTFSERRSRKMHYLLMIP